MTGRHLEPALLRDLSRRLAPHLSVRNLVLLIAFLALWWRLVYVADFPEGSLPGLPPPSELSGDQRGYHSVATNVLDGDGYVNSRGYTVLPPLYPSFLAGVFALSDESLTAARFAQAIIGAATVILVYVIGRTAFNRPVGVIAAALAAIYPWFIFYPRLLLTETLFIFVLSLTVLAMMRADRRPSAPNLALVGVLLTATNLVHASAVLLAPLFALWLLLRLGLRPGIRASAVVAVFALAAIAPWTIYNAATHEAFVPIASTGGVNLYRANNPFTIPGEYNVSTLPTYDPAYVDPRGDILAKDLPQIEEDRLLWRRGLAYIRDHPRTSLSNGWERVKLFWNGTEARAVFNTPLLRDPLLQKLDYLLVFSFWAGLALSLLRWKTAGVLSLVVLQSSLWHLIFPVMPANRSRVIIMTVVIVLSAFAFWAAWQAMQVLARRGYALYRESRDRRPESAGQREAADG